MTVEESCLTRGLLGGSSAYEGSASQARIGHSLVEIELLATLHVPFSTPPRVLQFGHSSEYQVSRKPLPVVHPDDRRNFLVVTVRSSVPYRRCKLWRRMGRPRDRMSILVLPAGEVHIFYLLRELQGQLLVAAANAPPCVYSMPEGRLLVGSLTSVGWLLYQWQGTSLERKTVGSDYHATPVYEPLGSKPFSSGCGNRGLLCSLGCSGSHRRWAKRNLSFLRQFPEHAIERHFSKRICKFWHHSTTGAYVD